METGLPTQRGNVRLWFSMITGKHLALLPRQRLGNAEIWHARQTNQKWIKSYFELQIRLDFVPFGYHHIGPLQLSLLEGY
ncbi:hypothetical protein DERF_014292 [Dermatophagoides farinae]|uniref:Uncharacterized protein n=1 Tax=Dermatophagoides farinae TaxID=6954 RepID=A0A922HHE2_DERFA|nr:hypothetical protein DERF_014292 [Dermatophagoides farinae]